MVFEFRLPDVGEGIHEAEVLAIKVKEGEAVKEYQPMFDVETDKAVVEITAPVNGTVEKIMVKVGEMAKVGNVMISFNTSTSPKASDTAKPAAGSKTQETAAKAGYTGNGRSGSHTALETRPVELAGPVPAAPATRRLARELGVDIRMIKGSGPAGRISKEDIRAYAEGVPGSVRSTPQPQLQPQAHRHSAPARTASRPREEQSETASKEPLVIAPVELPDFTKYGPVERVALRSLRRKIAINMTQSWIHVPHVAHFDQIDITELEYYRQKHEQSVAQQGGKLTLTVLVVKAIASALKKYPQFNSSLDENTSEIIYKHYYNIGVAVATERGLIVPVIKDADQKSVVEIACELSSLAQRTRDGKVDLEHLQGGTFTITNIGAIGGTGMMPMVNYPEVAIFGIAKSKEQPVVHNGEVTIRNILNVTLSFDHRVADGAEAAYFVKHVSECLEDPFKLLLEV